MATSSIPSSPKAKQRRALLKARQAMPARIRQEKSARICDHLRAWPVYQQAKLTLGYCSFNGEPDLEGLLSERRSWGLPRCEGKQLRWHRWHRNSNWSLRSGAYGITEPDPQSPQVEPYKVDLILIPCVACDINGYRLGYGGGFYDRMLSDRTWANKTTIGIVFEYARLPQLPTDEWDIPLMGVCTESGLFFRRDLGTA